MLANDVLHTIGNTPHIRINRLFGATHSVWIKSSAPTPAARSRTASRCRWSRRRSLGRAEARRHDHRADLGQHRHRPGDGRRGQGLQADAGDARQHERRAPPPDAGLWRDLRADAAREGHERLDRRAQELRRATPGAGCRSSSRTRPTSTCTCAPRRRRSLRLPERHRRADHRRGHRRPHHRLRAGAEEDVAEAEGVRGRAERVAGDQRRQAPARTRSRASAPASSRRTCTPICSTA
jgi:hypothetical protein